MPLYRCCRLNKPGGLGKVRMAERADDMAAVVHARALLRELPEYVAIEVWQHRRLVLMVERGDLA